MMQRSVVLKSGADFVGFRRAVRNLVAAQVAPEEVAWAEENTPNLFEEVGQQDAPPVAVPRRVLALAELVVCHRDPERFALLYELIWRISHGEPALPEVQSDPLVNRLELMRKAVKRDIHKMHAFLRFRCRTDDEGNEQFIAWFEPDHFIVEQAAEFFVERFRALHWTILTPVGSLDWNGEQLHLGLASSREEVPVNDVFEDGWRSYFESTFNPARLNPSMMNQQMPRKYWHTMPETRAIPGMIRKASERTQDMLLRQASVPVKRDPKKAVVAMLLREDDPKTLGELNQLILASEPLVPGAKQAVLGEGPPDATLMFVGEQPGDQEDLAGRPFVGPAGQLLSRAMIEADIDRTKVYLTNAVKHFKFEERGKRRLHVKPTVGEVKHYRWWLLKELGIVQPKIVVALGATALLALSGKALPILQARGRINLNGRDGFATVHPSFLLRLPEETARREAYALFVDDLKQIQRLAN